ncbi:MAG: hypothetical protein KDI47_03485 [Gammaproteobacteria bacterium]|nr:hypothetical protein [Gammaproteobacteria bacterium]
MLKRRDFLGNCAAGATALLAPAGLLAATGETNLSLKEKFQSLLNQGFRCLDQESGAVKLELIEVRDGPAATGLEQFSLVFQTGEGKLKTGLHEIYHPRTGLALYHISPSDSVAGRYTTNFSLFA